MQLKGTFTALITPFRNDQIDEEGLVRLIRDQINAGITGIVFMGSTGEDVTLTDEERDQVIKIGVREAKGKSLVIVGTGSNSTHQAIAKTKKAQALGADMALIVSPYYNRPTQEGIFRHYEAIATQVNIPIIVYNVQIRTAVNIETPTLLRLAALPNIIGVKEASANISQIVDVAHQLRARYPSFAVLSGDDAITLPMMALGATGVISVLSNLVPEKIVSLVNQALEGNFSEARKVHEELLTLFKMAFIEANPIPIKEAMALCGMPSGGCRLPLCEMRPENQTKLANLLSEMGLR